MIFALKGVTMAAPLFEETTVYAGGQDHIVEYRIPACVLTNQGTLLALCDARVDKPGDAPNNIDLALKRSTDGGKTWGPLEIIKNLPGDEAAADGCMLVDRGTGAVFIMYDHAYPTLAAAKDGFPPVPDGVQTDDIGRVIFLRVIRSQDQGRTWSDPLDLSEPLRGTLSRDLMAAPGTGITARDGRLIAPCYCRERGKPESQDGSRLLVSADHGRTWTLTPGPGPGGNECAVAELADGALLLNMRSYRGKGCRAVATTSDGGKTWSAIRDETALPEPVCQGTLIRYTDRRDGANKDRLLFANPGNSKARRGMTVRVSYDEGKTWPVAKLVHEGTSAYSSLVALPDGTIGLLYEQEKGLVFAHFNLEWLTDGQDSLTAK
jgi:sialidase-1